VTDAPEVVFFDFDGVILESADVKTRAFARIFAHRPSDQAQAFVEHHIANAGRSRYDKFAWAYENLFNERLDEAEMQRLDAAFSQLVEAELLAAPFVPGAVECLEWLRSEGVPCTIVSAAPERDLKTIIARRGIDRFFAAAKGSPTTKFENVAVLLEEFGHRAAWSLYIGDALSDLEAASAYGIPFVGRVAAGNGNPFPADVPTVRNLCLPGPLEAWAIALE
jgi:phosphoglycolate phosphatase-like HAD superfamily hydrolase